MSAPDLEDVNSDLHGSEEYRRAMVAVFTKRALLGGAGAHLDGSRCSVLASPFVFSVRFDARRSRGGVHSTEPISN